MSKESRAAYDQEVRDFMEARKGPEHRFGCGALYAGAGLAVAVHIAGALWFGQEIIHILTVLEQAAGATWDRWTQTIIVIHGVPMMAAFPASMVIIILIAVALYGNFPHKWVVEIPFWFMFFFIGIALVVAPVLRIFGR